MSKFQNNHIRNAGPRKENLQIEIPEENGNEVQVLQNNQIQNAEIQSFMKIGKNSPSGRNFLQSNQDKTTTPLNGIQPKRKNSGQEVTKIPTPKNSATAKTKNSQNTRQNTKQSARENQAQQVQSNTNFNLDQNITTNAPQSARQQQNSNPFLKKSEVPAFDSHKSPQTYIFKTNVHPTATMKSQTPSHRTMQEIHFSQQSTNEVKGHRISQTPTARTTQLLPNNFENDEKQKTQKIQANQNKGQINQELALQESYKMYGKREDVASEKQQNYQQAIMRPYSSTPKASVTKLSSQANSKTSKYNKQSESFDQTQMKQISAIQQNFQNVATKNLQQNNYQSIQHQLYQQYQQNQESKAVQEQKQKEQQENIQLSKVKQKQPNQKQQQQNINQLVTKVQQTQPQNQVSKKDQLTQQQIAQRSEAIYKEHLFQTFQAMKFVNQIPTADPEQLKSKAVYLQRPKGFENKRTIIFDLDETLVHCCDDVSLSPDVILPVIFPTGEQVNAGINIRPYARDCLIEANKNFEVIVFTASHRCYADVVLNYLDPDRNLIHHRLYRESCVITEGIYIKDLRILANRNLKDIVIVDNAAYSFGYQIDNGIPIISWHDDKYDKELYNLIDYLKILSESPDICEVNRRTFHLRTFYEDYLREFLQNSTSPKNKRNPSDN